MIITREEAIAYLNTLGDHVDWTGWSLEDIRDEVLKGDAYDGANLWGTMLESLDREDIDDGTTDTRKHLLDLIGEWMDGEAGYDTLEEHTSEDSIRLKDEASEVFRKVRKYLNSL